MPKQTPKKQTSGKVIQFRKETTSPQKTIPKKNPKAQLARLGVAVLLVVSLGFLCKSIHNQVQAKNDAEARLEEVKQDHRTTSQENARIKDEYQQTQDPDYLGEVARRDYFYSKPGELVFDLGDDNHNSDANNR